MVSAYELTSAALNITTEGGQRFSFARPLRYSLGHSLDDDTAPRHLVITKRHSDEVMAALDVPHGHPLIAMLDAAQRRNN